MTEAVEAAREAIRAAIERASHALEAARVLDRALDDGGLSNEGARAIVFRAAAGELELAGLHDHGINLRSLA